MAFQSLATPLFLLATATMSSAESITHHAQHDVAMGPNQNHHHGRITKLITYDYTECLQMPSLHCKNGSTCTPGIATFGTQHAHLDLQTHENGYHCKCPRGFIGHECEVPVDDCDDAKPGSLQSCYNGAKCKQNSNSKDGNYCDCIELNYNPLVGGGPTDTKYAGAMCQHESTSFCAVSLVGEVSPNHQFCTNHGQCVKLVTGGEPHPGCICKQGYMGDHCEIRLDPFTLPQMQTQDGGSATGGKVLFSIMIIVMVAVVIAIGVILLKSRNNGSTDTAVFQGESSSDAAAVNGGKTVVGEGDLDADGSGTLGSPTKEDDRVGPTHVIDDDDDDDDEHGDLELSQVIDMLHTKQHGYHPEAAIV